MRNLFIILFYYLHALKIRVNILKEKEIEITNIYEQLHLEHD